MSAESVTLSVRGRDYVLPLERLSEADRAFVLAQLEDGARGPGAPASPEPPADLAALRGYHKDRPIHTRRFDAWEGYFEGRFGEERLEFYSGQGIVDAPDRGVVMAPEEAVSWPGGGDFKPENGMRMDIYCPDNYDGGEGWGVLVWVQPGDWPCKLKDGWAEVFAKHKVVFCSTYGTRNEQADLRRMALALDGLATVRADYRIDPARVYAGGTSGGGLIAAVLAANHPEVTGVISSARSCQLSARDFPYLKPRDYRELKRGGQRWCFVTGDGDYNQEAVRSAVRSWEREGVPCEVFESPEQGHDPPLAPLLDEALGWLAEGGR